MPVGKSLLKAASPLCYASGAYPWLWRRHARRVPFTVVLVYHRVVDGGEDDKRLFPIERGTPARLFEAHLRFMLKRFAPIRAHQALDPARPPMSFAVTLDDGYDDNFRVAAPILDRLGIPATFFVVSDFVGTDRLFWWEQLADIMRRTPTATLDCSLTLPDLVAKGALPASLPLDGGVRRERAYLLVSAAIRNDAHDRAPSHVERVSAALRIEPRDNDRDYALMSWKQLEALRARGHDIGGHTATHCNLVGLDREALEREVVESHTKIEQRLGAPVLSFAHPYGCYEPRRGIVAEALARTGCRVAFVGRKGVSRQGSDPYELPRTTLNRDYAFAWAFNVQDAVGRSEAAA